MRKIEEKDIEGGSYQALFELLIAKINQLIEINKNDKEFTTELLKTLNRIHAEVIIETERVGLIKGRVDTFSSRLEVSEAKLIHRIKKLEDMLNSPD